ncbi:Phenylalanine--tRNA ligase beta subunit [Labeo rohita]|uniref:Phenylalanine--tRNA ligase beta subunit n=1 Tax=Labeo rohita TaxID=84645 RepID=A0ABQ8L9R0_LABRO|nr:Phenylalanine--tRNA ligase beta subunit [Labeo rohita]
MASDKNAFHCWKCNNNFILKSEKGTYITVQCKICLPAMKHSRTLLMQDMSQCDVMEDATASSSTQVVTQPPFEASKDRFRQCVNKLVFNFLFDDDVQCFLLVEQPSFRKLIEGISGRKKVMCRKTQRQTFGQHKTAVSSVTCHWIDKDTLERHSAALACTRLKGRHTYDAVAAKLNEIHAEYRIQNKVKSTVNDNGSNFFGVREDESDDYSDEVRFLDVGGLLPEDGDGEQFFLPQHQCCAAHTLNLIATNEIHKAASNHNKAHRSSLATEVVQEIANMHLTVPSVTRWNSEFRAITKLAGLPEEKLREICDKLDVPRLHPQESAFLKEYTETKLFEKMPHLLYNSHIVTTISEAIEERFGSVLASHEAKMATATLPKFCLNWLSPEKSYDMRRTLLQEAIAQEPLHSPATYLEDSDNNLTSLKAFPTVKRLFIKYNTTLPSSAPVEHLFSHGGNLLTSSRNRMSDDHMEQVLLLCYNKQHCPSDLPHDD